MYAERQVWIGTKDSALVPIWKPPIVCIEKGPFQRRPARMPGIEHLEDFNMRLLHSCDRIPIQVLIQALMIGIDTFTTQAIAAPLLWSLFIPSHAT